MASVVLNITKLVNDEARLFVLGIWYHSEYILT
jgi:hypothetical protein